MLKEEAARKQREDEKKAKAQVGGGTRIPTWGLPYAAL